MGFHTPPLRTVNPIHTMLNTTTARPRARARLATDDAPFDRVPPPPHTAHTHARAPAPQHMSTIFTTSLSAKASAKVRLAPRASSRAIHPTDGRDRDIRARVYPFASRDDARRATTSDDVRAMTSDGWNFSPRSFPTISLDDRPSTTLARRRREISMDRARDRSDRPRRFQTDRQTDGS